MRPLAALLTCLLLSLLANACGSSSKNAATQPNTAQTHKKDRDGDEDNNSDDSYVLNFGHVANATEDQAITTLIRRYYAAAAVEDGTTACMLLTPFVAESVVEQEGHSPGTHGKTCATVMSKLFKLSHSELQGKNTNLKIIRVGIQGNTSRVTLEFPEIHTIRQLRIRHQDGKWTVLSLLDSLIE